MRLVRIIILPEQESIFKNSDFIFRIKKKLKVNVLFMLEIFVNIFSKICQSRIYQNCYTNNNTKKYQIVTIFHKFVIKNALKIIS